MLGILLTNRISLSLFLHAFLCGIFKVAHCVADRVFFSRISSLDFFNWIIAPKAQNSKQNCELPVLVIRRKKFLDPDMQYQLCNIIHIYVFYNIKSYMSLMFWA